MKTTLIRLIFGTILFLFSLNLVYSSIEVFSNYNTELKVNSNNSIDIVKDLTIKNVYDVGIVPGQIEFKVGKGTEGSIGNIDISNVWAEDSFGNEIKSSVRKTKDYTVIILEVYYPLLPGFEYNFDLFYTLSYEPGGIFFKSLEIPLRESTIPIEQGSFKVILPENYHFTYLSSEGENSTIEGNQASWKIKDNLPNSVSFEYSYIPIRFGSFKGSYSFWIIVNVLLLLILIFEIRREIKRVRKQYEQ
ncbi:MAG: hypothetical protein KC589_04085 [Nanoarchaeota archaeon]|nr:hypothetical protein [Nanoarchaeota archaeon]MCA9496096.1 hypothetical protein [Nanoarchaeota archaeon]